MRCLFYSLYLPDILSLLQLERKEAFRETITSKTLRHFEEDLTFQKGSIYSVQHIKRLLKKYFKGNRISSHSLRKSFGRKVWENNGKSNEALVFLSEIFNHQTMAMTRKYLGIRGEIKDIYLNLWQTWNIPFPTKVIPKDC